MKDTLALLPVHGEAWKGVRYGCTARAGGVSQGERGSLNLGLNTGDDPERVVENRKRLVSGLPAEPLWLKQVHGVDVCDADVVHAGTPVADAAVTTTPGRVLAILTADCAPVVIADQDGRALGVAHAGWRGLAAGVVEATVQQLRLRVPAARGWRAWVGPCIGVDRFEVGEDVREAFLDTGGQAERYFRAGVAPGKWQADLAGLVRHRLETLGIHHIETCGLCTFDHSDLFYSYRRSPLTGRMATLAWLDGTAVPEFPH